MALQSLLWEATLENMDARSAEMTELQELLTAKDAESSELRTKNSKLVDELSWVKTQNATGGTISDDLMSVADSCDRPLKRAKVARLGKDTSTTPSMTAFPAMPAEWEDHKSRCETLTLETSVFLGWPLRQKSCAKS